jgi:hypothetical protein
MGHVQLLVEQDTEGMELFAPSTALESAAFMLKGTSKLNQSMIGIE